MLSRLRRHAETPDDLDDAIRVYMRRQEILYDPARRFRFLMPEAVLRYRLAPVDVMRGQLDRLIVVTTLSNVEIGIVPFQAHLPATPTNPFRIYNDSVVRVATQTRELMLRDAEDIAWYSQVFEDFSQVAVYGDEARTLIVRALDTAA